MRLRSFVILIMVCAPASFVIATIWPKSGKINLIVTTSAQRQQAVNALFASILPVSKLE